MPIIHFINSKSQSTGSMKNVLGYVSKEEKTQKKICTGILCDKRKKVIAWNKYLMETDGLFTGEPKCLHDEDVQMATYSDRRNGKITYRVWTVFDGKERTFDRLAELMLRQVESGEDVKE